MRETRVLPPLDATPFISVFSSFYNHEEYAARAIESVLAQDWPADRLEWVIFDDGSSDGTADVIQPYADATPWITFHRRENVGLRATVDRALTELRGDVITSIAGDDVMLPGKLRTQAEHLAAHPGVGLVYSDMETIDADGNVLAPSFMRANGLQPYVGRPLGKLLHHNFVSGGGIMLRADLLDVIHPIPPHAAWEDYWWAWAIAEVADLDYLDVPLYQYRQHTGNLAHGADGARLLRAQREELRFRRWLLGAVDPADATTVDLVLAVHRHQQLVAQMCAASGEDPEHLLPPSDQAPAAAGEAIVAARASLAAGDAHGAAAGAVRALHLDAHHPDVADVVQPIATAMARPPGMPERLPGTRGFVVLADAQELVDDPRLLEAYAAAVGPDDDATLVIHAQDWSIMRLDIELTCAVGRACLHAGDRDIAAEAGPAELRSRLEAVASAVLTARATGPDAYGPADAGRLRERVRAAGALRRAA